MPDKVLFSVIISLGEQMNRIRQSKIHIFGILTVIFLLFSLSSTCKAEIQGQNCFKTVFNNFAGSHDINNSYLLMLASYYCYADRIGATDFNDFKARYTEKFASLGFDKFDFISRRQKTGDTQLVVMSNSSTVVVAFRGSEGLKGNIKNLPRAVYDWLLTDLNFFKKRIPWWGSGVKVHKGFYNAVDIVYDDLKKLCVDHMAGAPKKLWITGHSLGAGLATVASFRLAKDGVEVQGIYAFGSPKVGNKNFVKVFGEELSNFQRWVNDNDLVTRVPLKWMKYVHIGAPNNIYSDGHSVLGAIEFSGKPKATSHPPIRYLQGLYSLLPMSVKIEVPAPPAMVSNSLVEDSALENQLQKIDKD